MKDNFKKLFYLLVVAAVSMALTLPAFAGGPSVQENQDAGKWNGIWNFGQGPMTPPRAGEDGCIPVGDGYLYNKSDCNGQNGVIIEANGGAPHRGAITFPLHIGILDTPQGRQPVYFVLSDTDEGNFAKEFGVVLKANNLKLTKAAALEFQSGETFTVRDADTDVETTHTGSDFEFHGDKPEVTAAEALSDNLPANADTRWVFFTSPGTTNFLKNFPPGTLPAGQHMYVKSDISQIFASPGDAKAAGLTVPPASHTFRVEVAMEVIKRTSTPNPDAAACYRDPVSDRPLTDADIAPGRMQELGLVTNNRGCVAERVLINAFPAFPRGHAKEGMASPFAIPIADFSPLKRLRWDGHDVTVNVSYVQWGPKANQRLINDLGGCDPLIRKNPPGPFALYGGGPGERCLGKTWADRYKGGQTLEINIESNVPNGIAASLNMPVPNVVKKAQQGSYMTDGDHPYYTPWEMSKCRASSVLGNVCAPKLAKMGDYSEKNHSIGRVIQSYNGKLVTSGGPGGWQHGLESYRGGIGRYTPMWHVTFLLYNCVDDPNGSNDPTDAANLLVTPTSDQGVLHSRMAKNFCNVSMQKKLNPAFQAGGPLEPFIPDTEASGNGSPIKGPFGLMGGEEANNPDGNKLIRVQASPGDLDGTCVPPFFKSWDARKFNGLQMQNQGAQCNAEWFSRVMGTVGIDFNDPQSRLVRNIRAMDDLKALGLVLETDTPPGQRKGEFGTPAGKRLVVSCPAYIDINI